MTAGETTTAPMSTAHWIVVSILALVAAGSLVGWFLVVRRMRRGVDPLPFEPRSPITWTGAEALLVVCAYVVSQSMAGTLARMLYAADLSQAAASVIGVGGAAASFFGSLSPLPRLLQGKVVGDLVFLALAWLVYRFARKTPPDQVGLATRPLVDLRIGLASFLLIVPPVILLQLGLVQLMGKSVHPVLVGLQHARDAELWIWSTVAVVGMAPLVEEFLFRGVIQNWLNRAWSFAANPQVTPAGQIVAPSPWGAAFAHDGPVVVTAGFFALVHLGNGPDPSSLFFFALGLGYLFRQTNRIWAGWIVHLLLNSFSLAALPLAP
jgi:membrane protease YdiL (CAAX protease family)